jgi:hypothetical protein
LLPYFGEINPAQLAKHSEQLGPSDKEYLKTEAQLLQVINHEYGNF